MNLWERNFKSQSYGIPCKKIKDYPIFNTYEFTFYRCIPFKEEFYGKTISELHSGNLRAPNSENRYSKLFPNQHISYWSGNKETAIKESCKHSGSKDVLVFEAYDDTSSFVPTITEEKGLLIVDGRTGQIAEIIKKFEEIDEISEKDVLFFDEMMKHKPDAMVYTSVVNNSDENFIFFENGFRKLSLHTVELFLNGRKSRNHNKVTCATGCDYSPILKSYGYSFEPIAKTKYHPEYEKTMEYKSRCAISKLN